MISKTLVQKIEEARQSLLNQARHKNEIIRLNQNSIREVKITENKYTNAFAKECSKMIDEEELINWFLQADFEQLPKPPFQLYPWAIITGHLFYKRLKTVILLGGIKAKSRIGDLNKLRSMITEL